MGIFSRQKGESTTSFAYRRFGQNLIQDMIGSCNGWADALAGLRKGPPEKVLIAVLLRERTSVSKGWIAQRRAMGYTGTVSRLTGMFHRNSGNTKRLRDLEKMLK